VLNFEYTYIRMYYIHYIYKYVYYAHACISLYTYIYIYIYIYIYTIFYLLQPQQSWGEVSDRRHHGHCSAVVQVAPETEDLWVAHATWDEYRGGTCWAMGHRCAKE
jgi:hypothetical protein